MDCSIAKCYSSGWDSYPCHQGHLIRCNCDSKLWVEWGIVIFNDLNIFCLITKIECDKQKSGNSSKAATASLRSSPTQMTYFPVLRINWSQFENCVWFGMERQANPLSNHLPEMSSRPPPDWLPIFLARSDRGFEHVVKSNQWLKKLILVAFQPGAQHFFRIGQELVGSVSGYREWAGYQKMVLTTWFPGGAAL